MAAPEPFEFITSTSGSPDGLIQDYRRQMAGKMADLDVQLVSALRDKHPDLIVTTVPVSNTNLLRFAAAGYATADLDTQSDSVLRWRGFIAPLTGSHGSVADATSFARYHYTWAGEHFIVYFVAMGLDALQYILKEPRGTESTLDNSSVTDGLIKAVGEWVLSIRHDLKFVYVYDRFWRMDTEMYHEVQKANWDKVILDEKMKKNLVEVSDKFFDSKETYDDFGVPWKRGLIFHGPPGNGKTISIKALMHTLYARTPKIPSLYVKSAPYTYDIRSIFVMARALAPCLLILEDIETIVTSATRSYFFNEVDGLNSNNGILMIASTNYLDRLDPGLSKRPSRFDRKYLFPLPNKDERTQYAAFWRGRLKAKPAISFPELLCAPIADITHGFSFAYMQEAFVATLLALARTGQSERADDASQGQNRDHEDGVDDTSGDDDDEDLDQYPLWVEIKNQVQILREDMDDSDAAMQLPFPLKVSQKDDGLTAQSHYDTSLAAPTRPSPDPFSTAGVAFESFHAAMPTRGGAVALKQAQNWQATTLRQYDGRRAVPSPAVVTEDRIGRDARDIRFTSFSEPRVMLPELACLEDGSLDLDSFKDALMRTAGPYPQSG